MFFNGSAANRAGQASKCFVLPYFCFKSNPSTFKMQRFSILLPQISPVNLQIALLYYNFASVGGGWGGGACTALMPMPQKREPGKNAQPRGNPWGPGTRLNMPSHEMSPHQPTGGERGEESPQKPEGEASQGKTTSKHAQPRGSPVGTRLNMPNHFGRYSM